MYLYLQLLCIFVLVPNIILLYLNRKRIHLKTLGIALVLLFIIAVVWDQLSVRMGLWVFTQDEVIGNLFGLPIEEYLFFLFGFLSSGLKLFGRIKPVIGVPVADQLIGILPVYLFPV